MIVLGIETSCDETGVALYSSEAGLIAHGLYSQVAIHAEFGGVVPELASRDHVRKLAPMVRNLLDEAGLELSDLGGVAYTAGPGLAGALLVGASVARSLAHGLGIPAVGVHHMEGHLLAPMLEDDPPAFPFLALLVSGGHTLLVEVDGVGEYKVLGESVDDAAGEAFDKTAKLLGLPYPGGPALAALATTGDPARFRLPRPMTDRPGLDFSFSGLKTAVMVALREVTGDAGAELDDATQDHATQDHATRADMARAFEDAVVETLAIKCSRALDATGLDTLIVAGGVGANRALRLSLDQLAAQRGARVHYPRPEFCTDNGAMIAYAGYCRLAAGEFEDERIKVRARWPLAELVPPGDARRVEGTP